MVVRSALLENLSPRADGHLPAGHLHAGLFHAFFDDHGQTRTAGHLHDQGGDAFTPAALKISANLSMYSWTSSNLGQPIMTALPSRKSRCRLGKATGTQSATTSRSAPLRNGRRGRDQADLDRPVGEGRSGSFAKALGVLAPWQPAAGRKGFKLGRRTAAGQGLDPLLFPCAFQVLLPRPLRRSPRLHAR